MGDVNFYKTLREGDRLVLYQGLDGNVTRIDEITSEETFAVVQPWTLGQRFTTHVGAKYRVVCTTATGVHTFRAETSKVDETGKVKMMELKYTGDYERTQNRQAFRCQVMVPLYIRHKPAAYLPKTATREIAWVQSKTLDISVAGLKARLPGKFIAGDVVIMRLCLDKFGMNETVQDLTGIVRRAVETTDGTKDNICGIEFINVEPKVRATLSRFVMACQRKQSGKHKERDYTDTQNK